MNEPNDPRQGLFPTVNRPHERHDPLAVRRAAMLTAGIGLVHALLLMAGAFVLKTQTPGVAASDEELIAFYQDPDQRRIVVAAGLYLIPFAGIAFIWFFVALRMWISASAPRANVMLSNVQLVSGIIYTTLILAAGGAMSVPAVTMELSKEPSIRCSRDSSRNTEPRCSSSSPCAWRRCSSSPPRTSGGSPASSQSGSSGSGSSWLPVCSSRPPSAHGWSSSFRRGFWCSASCSSIAPERSRAISWFRSRESWCACDELRDREAPGRPRQFHQNVLIHEESLLHFTCPWKLLAPVRRHDSDWEYTFCRMLLRPSFAKLALDLCCRLAKNCPSRHEAASFVGPAGVRARHPGVAATAGLRGPAGDVAAPWSAENNTHRSSSH